MRHATLQFALALAAVLFVGGCTSVTTLRQTAVVTPSPISARPSVGAGDSLGESVFANPAGQEVLDALSNTRTWNADASAANTPAAGHALAARD